MQDADFGIWDGETGAWSGKAVKDVRAESSFDSYHLRGAASVEQRPDFC